MECNTEVVRNEKAGRTIVRFGMLVIVIMYDSGKGNRYQIITDTHRNHATGRYNADSIVPQDRPPLSEVRYPKIRCNILARIAWLCPIYCYQRAEGLSVLTIERQSLMLMDI